jgi:hypothetical protein
VGERDIAFATKRWLAAVLIRHAASPQLGNLIKAATISYAFVAAAAAPPRLLPTAAPGATNEH